MNNIHKQPNDNPKPYAKREGIVLSNNINIRNEVKRHNISAKNTNSSLVNNHERPHHYLTKKIKYQVYQQTLSGVKEKLSHKDKVMSSIVHNKYIEPLSEVGSRIIARPSAILGGSIFMVFGGLIVILIAKQAGFELPFSVLPIMYLLGFILTLALGLIVKIFKKAKR